MGVEQASASEAQASSRTLVGKYTPYEANTFMLEVRRWGVLALCTTLSALPAAAHARQAAVTRQA